MRDLSDLWFRLPGATSESIAELRSEFGDSLPESYCEFLSWSDGGEGSLSVQPYNLCLDSAPDTVRHWRDATYQEFFPGFIVIGSNGAGEYIAFDTRSTAPWPVVALDMTNSNLTESVLPIASTFDELVDLICD
ncbi:SMI1 / KNR4 family protein [Posidoniimonas polymericola]|uniref:SMI1 / KNR4 family protein n=1 Tax=Posidoniimonas polymericola TaxID=2528002 RepID=A0A5C5YD93_9BACT|nr:SMI1/KNR4 family protein [Posidoniimonas polymericola]TWT72753.1 SMI1 / KNR4 family protein [Posidoniimonas polymericola]